MSVPIIGGGTASQLQALAPAKAKLAAGQSVVFCDNADSTGYDGGTGNSWSFKFCQWLAARYPTHSVLFIEWAEWVVSAPTGPKAYGTPVQISTGSTGATITYYNLSLPGDVPVTMLDPSRYPNAIQNIQPIDVMFWYQGKNLANAGFPSTLSGSFFGPMGRVIADYPACNHVMCSQLPNQSGSYFPIYGDILSNVSGNPGIGYIDTYTPFILAGLNPALYVDDEHPSPLGTTLIAQTIENAFAAAPSSGSNIITPWTGLAQPGFISNGDFSSFSGAVPTGWNLQGTAAVSKDTVNTFGGAAYSAAISAADGNSYLAYNLTTAQNQKIAGKIVTFAMLCYAPPSLPVGQVPFMTLAGAVAGPNTGSLQRVSGQWIWQVLSGCVIPAGSVPFVAIRIYPAFAIGSPNPTPCNIQRVTLVEGYAPRGQFL